VAATGFGGVAPGPRPSPHRPRSMLRRPGSWRATPADLLAEHGICGRPHQGAEHHRRGERRHPDGSNAGDVVKARGGDPGINRAARHRQEAAAFKQGMDLPQLGATRDRRLELRASRGSCQREGSEHRPRERRRREQDPRPEGDRGRRDPTAPSSPTPRHRRVAIRLTGRAVHAGERRVTATALNSADVFATGMRDQSRLIVRADSSITASC
jgi:hypothetical protein